MKKQVTRNGLLKIFFITAFLAVAYMLYYPYSPAVTQRKNMALAKEHTLVLQKMICKDTRFEKVVISDGGTSEKIWVDGFVKNEEDLATLNKLVSDSNPPRPVKLKVRVQPHAF